MNWTRLTPMRGKLVVKREEIGEKNDREGAVKLKDSLLYIPAEAAEFENKRRDHAIVLAVGEPRITDSGATIPVPVQPGDRVLITPYGGTRFTYREEDGSEVTVEVLTSEEIVAKVNG